ncbi:MAG: ABC transporter permease [Arcanobacterium sp.]|nr:ABC transporter permease [Arcanobacterium sp.]MDY5589679.1 FtsX-like permease family protein [Arcanobacterium sp.]
MYLPFTLLRRSLRHSTGRLALICTSVAFAVYILLTFAAYFNAFNNHNADEWKLAIGKAAEQSVASPNMDLTGAVVVYQSYESFFTVAGANIHALYIDSAHVNHGGSQPTDLSSSQPTHPNSAQPNHGHRNGSAPYLYGLTWPRQGEYLVSEGLRTLIKSHPEYELTRRFGSTPIGALPYQLTSGPDDLLVFIGADLSAVEGAVPVRDFSARSPLLSGATLNQAILVIGLVVVLFPVLLLISISATLGSSQREQRYAALRLVGATQTQILQILLVEALLGALVGYVLGAMLFALTHSLLGGIPIAGKRLWLANLEVPAWQYLLVGVVTLLLVVGAHANGMRAVSTSPLGVVRRQKTQPAPSPLRLLPLCAALAIFLYLYITVPHNRGATNDTYPLLAGVLLMMGGLVLASPWIVRAVAQLVGAQARSAPVVIGTKYVAAHASRISRSVAGVVLALYAGTFFITTVSEAGSVLSVAQENTSIIQPTAAVISQIPSEQTARALAAQLSSQPYVLHAQTAPQIAGAWSVIPCTDAPRYFSLSCSAKLVGVHPWAPAGEAQQVVEAATSADFSTTVAQNFGADTTHSSFAVLVQLDRPTHLEQFRSELATARNYPLNSPWLLATGERDTRTEVTFTGFMTYVVYGAMALTLVVAVISGLVSTYASILERRRSLLTLRLGGMRVSELTRMLLIESAAPLAVIATLATALGFGSGWLLMHIFSTTLDAHFTPALLGALVGALALATLSLLSLVPALKAASAPANNRSE